jgi:hypothetical protein
VEGLAGGGSEAILHRKAEPFFKLHLIGCICVYDDVKESVVGRSSEKEWCFEDWQS